MDTYIVKITKQAEEHLRAIRDYISEDLLSPDISRKMLSLIKEKIQSLSYMPERNPLIQEEKWRSLGIRRLIVKNYYVYYMLIESEKKVQVIGIVYGKRDQFGQLEQLQKDDMEFELNEVGS